jgi:peptidyl-tRNA hydrolase, PTH1 family
MIKLIVGLGNPGDKYKNTRHNFGFEVIDSIAKKVNASNFTEEKKFKSLIAKVEWNGNQITLMKPQTYMNLSGKAVQLYAQYFKIKPEEILVIHDELDILLGKMKIRKGGSAAGNHGVESIIETLGRDDFIRLRLGIGAEKTLAGEHNEVHFLAEEFVIAPFEAKEKSKVKSIIKRAVQAVETILNEGFEKAQNQFN